MISFASSTGNLFNILGKLGLLIKQASSYQASQKTNLIDTTNGVVAQLNAESDLQALIGSNYISQLNSPGDAVGQLAQSVAAQVINRVVFRDNPRLSQTLQELTVAASIREVIRQMQLAGASILAMTIGATPSAFIGVGNGVISTSTKRPIDGLVLENSFAENLLLTCTSDSYTGNTAPGNEGFALTGTGQESDPFAFDWPLGSNAQISLNAINGNASNSQGNLLSNSGFENWTNNVPNGFTLITGVAGTNIVKETGILYDGVAALKIVGDGTNLTELRQTFGANVLTPLSQYSLNVFIRRDAVAAGAGQLTLALIDANGVVINDANNVPNSFTVDLTSPLTTSYVAYKGAFRTPIILPPVQNLQIKISTALTNGRSVYLDKMSMGSMNQAYLNGPSVAIHSGAVPFVGSGAVLLGSAAQPDYATVVVTNSRGAGGTLNTWQTLLARLFYSDVFANEFLFPSSATPTISDSALIS